MTRRKLTPYEKIRRAAINNTGTRLTAEECFYLYYLDDAIKVRADADDGGYDDRDGGPIESIAEDYEL